jgi:hypothetical protein
VFSQICRTIRELRFQRALWLDALIRIREVQMQPLPLSTTEALDALSLPELQIAVQQAHRLMQNLQSDTPLPVRIHTFSVNAGAQVLCIPGASLAVSHILGGVSCWDILTGHRVAHLEIPELQIRTEVCMKIKGKALIGAHTRYVTMRCSPQADLCCGYSQERRKLCGYLYRLP